MAVDYAGALSARLRWQMNNDGTSELPGCDNETKARTCVDVAPTFAIGPCCDEVLVKRIWQGRVWSLQKHKLDDGYSVASICWRALLRFFRTGVTHQE